MNRDWLKKQLGDGVSDDVIDAIMGKNGEDINKEKSTLSALRAQYDEVKAKADELEANASASLSNEEKWQKQLDAANKAAAKARRELNEMAAAAVFATAGVSEEEYAPFLGSIVTDDRDKTVASAKAISDLISAKVSEATEKAGKDALAGMGGPKAGSTPSGPVTTRKQFMELSYDQQRELKASNPDILSQLT